MGKHGLGCVQRVRASMGLSSDLKAALAIAHDFGSDAVEPEVVIEVAAFLANWFPPVGDNERRDWMECATWVCGQVGRVL